ncbi:MAG: purine-nucleoside phosphorylase [Deltaproteobacteria bacterium]|nr:MAG: purine-nucleoside phosphorylase [Deltaproteobacteria bacterium]
MSIAPNADLAQIDEAADALRALGGPPPEIGVVLGSGLGAFADALEAPRAVPYADLPHFPVSGVEGHAGRFVLGRCGGVPVAVMQGRVHAYEGWSMQEVAFGVRVIGRLGAKGLIVTNAAGGIHHDLVPGDLMRITDHINMTGRSPLTGRNVDALGPRFPDMSEAYDRRLSELLERVAADERLALRRGVYACMPGPAYETPAEIRMLRTLGADAVGMSTVPEVLAARHMGLRVVGVSVITNLAAGLSGGTLSHEEVKETADAVRARFVELLQRFLPEMAAAL